MEPQNEYKYLTIKDIVEGDKYPFTYRQMRYFLTFALDNGLHEAARQVGKYIIFREDLFIKWIEKYVFDLKAQLYQLTRLRYENDQNIKKIRKENPELVGKNKVYKTTRTVKRKYIKKSQNKDK